MKIKFGKYLLCFAGINLAAFLIFYISSYIIMNESIEYVRYFISEAIDFALPVVTAALMAMALAEFGFRSLFIGLAAALARLVYLYPAMYLEFVGPQNLPTDSALLVALPVSLGLAVIDLLFELFLLFVIYIVCDVAAGRRGMSYVNAVADAHYAYDVAEPFTLGVFAAGSVRFLISLVLEIIDTVEFFADYADTYTAGEVIYIAISFIMILAELLLAQAIIFKIKTIKESGRNGKTNSVV